VKNTMTHLRKTSVVPFLAAVMLLLAVSSASANRLSVSNRFFRATWSSIELGAAGTVSRCPVTLEGSFHSATIRKVEESLIGHITRAIVSGATCTGGVASVLGETLPWHLTYQGFRGPLPNIQQITIALIGDSFRVDPEGILPACLARTTVEHPLRGFVEREAGGAITGVSADPSTLVPLSGGFGCGIAEASFSGRGTVTGLGTTTRATLTLI
jgi:hypothetical protein